MSPSAPVPSSGTATINRTLLHSQQFGAHGAAHGIHSVHSGTHGGIHTRNGNARGLANHLNGDSPPPTYDDVHDISLQRHGFFFLIIFSPFLFLHLFFFLYRVKAKLPFIMQIIILSLSYIALLEYRNKKYLGILQKDIN